MLSLLGPVTEVSGLVTTLNPDRTHFIPDKADFGEKFRLQAENLVVGNFRFASGVFGALLGLYKSCETRQFYTMTSTFQRPAPIPRGYLDENYGSSAEAGLAI
jgi:hypothetical protein